MGIVNGSLQLGYKDNAWFTANASLVLLVGQIVYLEQTGTYKIGNGVTALSALSFLGGGSGSGVQSVSGTNVDNTDPLNPIVLEQTTIAGETIETQNNKGQANGYVELDGSNRILFPAQANPSVKSIIRNINATSRNYIFPDSNGTVALTTDIPSIAGLIKVIAKDIATSSALTGTTAITLLRSILIPANTFTTGDVCRIFNRSIRSTATGSATNYIYINTSASLSGATLVGTQTAGSRFYGMERNLYIKSSTVSETVDTSTSVSGDSVAVQPVANSNLNIDWTVNQYIIHAFANAATGNSTVSSGLIVQKM
jgi:hypothetical protein